MSEQVARVKALVKGGYDLQQLRMQAGLRLCANFRAKLKEHESDDVDAETGELSAEAEGILDKLKSEFKLLTTGIAKNRTLSTKQGFTGTELISTFSELVLIDQYIALEREEGRQFRQFETVLDDIPIYAQYLKQQRGVGPAMAGVIISTLDPHKARHVSSFWKFAGLDVGPDGRGRSRRAEHLVDRTYIDRNGNEATRKGVTYDPWLKTKLTGVLAGSFLRSASPWRQSYDNYKHRLETDPARIKVTVTEWKKINKTEPERAVTLWTPGRIDHAAKRFMVKAFLADLWLNWRRLEGLPVTPPYHEARRGYGHGQEAAE